MYSLRFRNLFLALLAGLALPVATLAQNDKKPPKLVAPKRDPNQIYDAVAQPAEPVGGMETYSRYLGDNLTYPTKALERRVQGTDSVTFVVERNGTISGVTLKAGFDADCDAEALRVIKGGPKWKPAHHMGDVVRQRITVPVTFALPPQPAAPAGAPGTPPAGPPTTSSVPAPASAAGTTATVGSTLPNGLKVIQPEVGAQPPGGTDAFFAWIQKNIQYPAAARRQKVEGKIRVEFMVEPDGSLSNFKVLNHLNGGLEQEAIRVIKASPKWEPAKYQGEAIRQKMVMPVIFQL